MSRVKKYPWAGMSGPSADFLKMVDDLARQRTHREVFHDFLEAAFCAFRSPLTPAGEKRQAIEDRYQKVIKIDDRYLERFPELLAITAAGIDEQIDFLGPMSGHLGTLNEAQGQFFTPWALCQFMAQQTIQKDHVERCIVKNGFITMQESIEPSAPRREGTADGETVRFPARSIPRGRSMTSQLSDFGHDWQDLVDHVADWSVDLLRRAAAQMAHGVDRDAQRDIEGATEWRDLNPKEKRYASARS